jgi:two-component system, OmpR family, KDP operon response regulator KdpE
MNKRILVVDDEAPSSYALRACLVADGYEVTIASTGSDALRSASLRPYAAVLLDLGLPDLPGLEVCRRLREFTQVPILVVTCARATEDKVALLDAGADQFIEKPFMPEELLARLRATLRRIDALRREDDPVIRFGDVEVDLARREVRRAGEPVHLTPHEYGVLAELARHHDRPLTHPALLRAVWGATYDHERHYLWVCIRHLRTKLETEPSRPQFIVTEPRVGYRLRTTAAAQTDASRAISSSRVLLE